MIALGYVSVRGGLFAPDDLRVLGRFVLHFALPALLFNALARSPVASILEPVYLAAYAASGVGVMLGAFLWERRVRRRDAPASAIIATGMSFPNLAFVGYPIIVPLLGAAGRGRGGDLVRRRQPADPAALARAGRERRAPREPRSARWRAALAATARNPMIVAIVAGFVVALAGVHAARAGRRARSISSPARRPRSRCSSSAARWRACGCAAWCATFPRSRSASSWCTRSSRRACLALLPPLDPAMRIACIACASMPMVSIYPILAQKYRLEGLAAAALLVTTIASFFTINVVPRRWHGAPR